MCSSHVTSDHGACWRTTTPIGMRVCAVVTSQVIFVHDGARLGLVTCDHAERRVSRRTGCELPVRILALLLTWLGLAQDAPREQGEPVVVSQATIVHAGAWLGLVALNHAKKSSSMHSGCVASYHCTCWLSS